MAAANTRVPTRSPEHSACQWMLEVLGRVGDRWTILVVVTLADGALRYNELRRAIGSISQRMLTRTLKRLEEDGLVERTVYPTVPPRVDYELTELGRSLLASLAPLHAWAMENRQAVAEARSRFRKPGQHAAGQQTASQVAALTLH